MSARVYFPFVLVFALAIGVASAATSHATELVIGFVEMKKDDRYTKRRTFARFLTQPLGRPFTGAEVALKEVRFHGAKTNSTFALQRITVRDDGSLLELVEKANDAGVQYFILDLPSALLSQLTASTAKRDLLLFNVSAREDHLRQEQCAAHLLHITPSDAMITDALAQFLALRKWRNVLALTGPLPRDAAFQTAFERAAKRFGISIADKKPFVLSNDPRQRRQNNLALLTGRGDYDVVFVADTDGEFARDVPYSTAKPRPVVGAEGLAATAWHWAWDRHGAPQLEKRFEKHAKRPMRDVDWAAWLSVKVVAEAVQRTESTDFGVLQAHIQSGDLVIDGFKGNRLDFRSWNNQLRQPILIGTHNRIIARAPIDGFLHKINNLDTLGFDQRESKCRLASK